LFQLFVKVFAWQLDEAFPAWTPWQIISWGQLNSIHLIFFYFYSRFPCLIEFVFLSRERVSNITIKTLVMNKKKKGTSEPLNLTFSSSHTLI
jgi:hypothetical protein